MQAVILVGGEGTRLRPLTSTVPKPVVPLVDRPFISFMLDWLARHGIDDVIMSCGFLADGVRNVLGDGSRARHPPALRRGARAARHRRRAEVRRADARRALPDAQRRRAHRHRPERADRPARAHRRDGHARARAGRRPQRLRPGAPQRGPLGARLRREAQLRRDRHEPDQRRRLRARARDPRARPPDRNVSIEREVWPRLVGDGLYGFPSRATGSTSARPSATCRARSTSSRATSTRRRASASATTGWRVDDGADVDGRVIPPARDRARLRVSPRAPTSAACVVLGEGVVGRRRHDASSAP